MATINFLAKNVKTKEIRFGWVTLYYEKNRPMVGKRLPEYSIIRHLDLEECKKHYQSWLVVKVFDDDRTNQLIEIIENLDTLSIGNNGLFQLLCDFGEECANTDR